MALKSTLEGGNSFDLTYPDGTVVDAAYIDNFTRESKEAKLKRLEEEHFWPDKASLDLGDIYEVAATGRHEPGAGRCDSKTYVALTGDPLFAVGNDAKKLGAIIRINAPILDATEMGKVLYYKHPETGALCPLIKHIRGKVWVTGGFVHGRLTTGMHNTLLGGVTTFEDEEGVHDITAHPGTEIGYNLYNCYEDPDDPSRNIWIEKVWSGDPSTMAHAPGSNETLIWDIEDYGGPDKGLRVELSKGGFAFTSDIPPVNGPYVHFNGLKVREHDHTGGADGEILDFHAISEGANSRIHQRYENCGIGLSTVQTHDIWKRLDIIAAADWNNSQKDLLPPHDSTAYPTRGLTVNLFLDEALTAGECLDFMVVISTFTSSAQIGLGLLAGIVGGGICQVAAYDGTDSTGSMLITLPTAAAGGPAYDVDFAIYLRPIVSRAIGAASTADIIAEGRRR